MGSSRLRTGLVVATAALAVLIGGTVVPSAASAADVVPTNLSPNDPTSAPTSPVPSSSFRTNIILSWSPIAGASSYDVEISDGTGTFETPSVSTTTTLTTFNAPPGLVDGDYAWRVRTHLGAWSDTAWFTRGWPVSPGNPHQVSTAGPVVAWDALPNASYYEVQFSAIPFPPSPFDLALSHNPSNPDAFVSCNTTATVISPHVTVDKSYPTLLRDAATNCNELTIGSGTTPAVTATGSWYWRVRGRDGVLDTANNSVGGVQPAQACSGVWALKLEDDVPETPACSSWAYPSGPATQVTKLASTVPDVPGSLDIGPKIGTATAPAKVSSSPVFSWADAGPRASFYRVTVSRDSTMKSHDFVWETQGTSLSPLAQLPDHATRWYWTVQSCAVPVPDSKGFLLPESVDAFCSTPAKDANDDPFTFIQASPETVQPISDTSVTGGRQFIWKTLQDGTRPLGSNQVVSPDPSGYQFQISDSKGSFASAAYTTVTDAHGTTPGETRLSLPSSVLPNGYKWRVRAVDETSNKYPWSAARTVGTLQSATATLTTPSGFGLDKPLAISFDAPVSNVSTSTVRIVATSNGATFPGTLTPTSGTGYQFNPRGRWVAGESYGLAVSGVSTAGTAAPAIASGRTTRATTTLDSASSSISRVNGDYGWTTAKASDAKGGTYLRSNDKAKTAKRSNVSAQVRGSKVYIYGCYGKSSGKARIYVDGKTRATIDLYRTYSKCGKVATVSLTSGSVHTVKFAPLGSKRKKAKSSSVRFDGFVVA